MMFSTIRIDSWTICDLILSLRGLVDAFFSRKMQYFLCFQSILKSPKALYGNILDAKSWKKCWKSPDSCVSGWVDIFRYQVFLSNSNSTRRYEHLKSHAFFFKKKASRVIPGLASFKSILVLPAAGGKFRVSKTCKQCKNDDFWENWPRSGRKIL